MNNEAKVGLFVIVALLIFVATFLSVATMQLGGDRVPYRAHFKFVGGLEAGKTVRFGGLQAGVITNVGPSEDDPTVAEVRFELKEEIPINQASVAKISSLNALGDNYLEITPGEASAARIPPNGVVQSEEAITFTDITAKVADVTDTAQALMVDVKEDIELLVGDLRVLAQNLQELTGPENQRNVEQLLANSNEMIETQAPKIDQITTQISELLEKVDVVVTDLRTVAQSADKTVRNVDQTVTDLKDPIERDLEELQNTLAEARSLIGQIETTVVVNQDNLNETLENFRVTSENLEQFSDEIRQRPWSLLRAKPKEDRQVPATVAP